MSGHSPNGVFSEKLQEEITSGKKHSEAIKRYSCLRFISSKFLISMISAVIKGDLGVVSPP